MNWRWRLKVRLLYLAAFLWRRILFRTTFIAITGSVGKTTAKELLAAALSSRFPTAKTFANQNGYSGVPRSLLRVRPWHRFAVIETATGQPGLMRRAARLVRPEIAVVLRVAREHMNRFRTLDGVAAEKAQLLQFLRPNETAVLNGDDTRVAVMADPGKYRVILVGSAESAAYRADAMSSQWPERFSFQLQVGGECRHVQTRLVGTHWKDSVMAALATAHVCGLTLDDAIEAIGSVEPTPARMQPVSLSGGAILIRDECDGSVDTLDQALEVLAQSSAARKILVISDVTDTSRSPRDRLAKIGRRAAQFTGLIVFVGPRAEHGVRGATAAGMSPQCALGFASWEPAADFLKGELKPGDLALLRGRTTDHLSRIYFSQIGTVGCHNARCERTIICDLCPELKARIL